MLIVRKSLVANGRVRLLRAVPQLAYDIYVVGYTAEIFAPADASQEILWLSKSKQDQRDDTVIPSGTRRAVDSNIFYLRAWAFEKPTDVGLSLQTLDAWLTPAKPLRVAYVSFGAFVSLAPQPTCELWYEAVSVSKMEYADLVTEQGSTQLE